MAKFVSGEKADRKEAEKQLRIHVAGVWDGRFDVRFENDDGGSHLVLWLEVESPSEQLEQSLLNELYKPKWMGWRFLIMKCPPDYIDYVLNSTLSDDY